MANIYLRVPSYVAAFYRHRDEKKPLGEWDPVTFENFSYEQRLLRHGICTDKTKRFLSVLCYSAAAWKNICAGKLPQGGKIVFVRDVKNWPTAREIVALEGRALKANEEQFDYLCIQLPREVQIGDTIMKTDNSCSLNGQVAQMLANVLRDEYYHFFYEWISQETAMFDKKGLHLSKEEAMERFYAQYDIPMLKGTTTQNSMRMMVKRLFAKARKVSTRRTKMQGEYFTYIGNGNRKRVSESKP